MYWFGLLHAFVVLWRVSYCRSHWVLVFFVADLARLGAWLTAALGLLEDKRHAGGSIALLTLAVAL